MKISEKDQLLIVKINEALQLFKSKDVRNLFLLKSLQNWNCIDESAEPCKYCLLGSWLCRPITEKIRYIEDKLNEEENENEQNIHTYMDR